jgi:hypothetical protein
MATPASRATSVIVGPEWRRFAGFRVGGTEFSPDYIRRLRLHQLETSVSPDCCDWIISDGRKHLDSLVSHK